MPLPSTYMIGTWYSRDIAHMLLRTFPISATHLSLNSNQNLRPLCNHLRRFNSTQAVPFLSHFPSRLQRMASVTPKCTVTKDVATALGGVGSEGNVNIIEAVAQALENEEFDDNEEEDNETDEEEEITDVCGGLTTFTTTSTRTTTTTAFNSISSTTATTVTGDGEFLKDQSEDDEYGEETGARSTDADPDETDSDAWETESFYEDAIGNLSEVTNFGAHENACTPEETQQYRKRLREVGMAQFIQEMIITKSISPKKLITAFGIRPPGFLDGAPDSAFLPLLQAAMAQELSRRRKLEHINTLEDVARLLKKSKNIIVLTGAGISTSLGIPDFRSKDNGLYSRLAGLGLSDPQEVFDIEVFQEDPTIFYSIAKDILPSTDKFSPTHAFIELLQSKNKLLTQYTQNIDNLETRAGIRPEKLIQCHGSFATASCVKCKYKVPGETIFPDLREGRVARCEKCSGKANGAGGKKRKRGGGNTGGGGGKRESTGSGNGTSRKQKYSEESDDNDDYSTDNIPFSEAGIMKPDITFFGEQLPASFHDRLIDHDRGIADLLICIGTSLKVAPVSEIVQFLPANVPQIYISKTPVTHVEFDVELLGNCDDVVVELCRMVGWELRHEMIPEGLELKVDESEKGKYTITRAT